MDDLLLLFSSQYENSSTFRIEVKHAAAVAYNTVFLISEVYLHSLHFFI